MGTVYMRRARFSRRVSVLRRISSRGRNKPERVRVLICVTTETTEIQMAMYLKRSLLALIPMALASVAMAENPPASNQDQKADPTAPTAASSPHQRQATKQEGTEATSTADTTDTDPAASSTRHQQQTTGVRTAKTKAEKDQMMKDCVKQARARDSSMSQDQAKKSCMEQMKSTERAGGG